MAIDLTFLMSPGGRPLFFGASPVVWRTRMISTFNPVPFSADEYREALAALLPRGRVWPRDPDAVLQELLSGFAPVYHRTHAAAVDLLVEAFPPTAVQMLPEWEATLGLPSAYGTPPTTTEGRQQAVVAALTDTGGQSPAYFQQLAARLGFSITIDQFRAYNVNASVITPITDDAWAHTWRVNAPASIATTYTPSVDIVQAVPGVGNPLLEFVLARYKPAHTVCITSYN